MSKAPESTKTAEQHARFLETARALGCDEDEAAFNETLKKIVPKNQASGKRVKED